MKKIIQNSVLFGVFVFGVIFVGVIVNNVQVKANGGVVESDTIYSLVAENSLADGDYTVKLSNNEEIDFEIQTFDDNVTYSSDPTLCDKVPDTKMCVLKYRRNLTIEQGVTLTPQVRKKGLILVVNGTLVNKGNISMTARGANAVGQNVLLLNQDGGYEFVPAIGGAGGARAYAGGTKTSTNPDKSTAGNVGGAGLLRGAGGGGSGASYVRIADSTGHGYSGAGADGTSYSGGAGGGGVDKNCSGTHNALAGAANGGRGGNAISCRANSGWAARGAGGGAGNPGGSSHTVGGLSVGAGVAGTGGLVVVYAGNLGNEGTIVSKGSNGGTGRSGGGSSGGGSINLFYRKSIDEGVIDSSGGGRVANGGNGGAGSVTTTHIEDVDPRLENLTLSAGTLSPSFDPDIHYYDVTLTAEDDVVDFIATPTKALTVVDGAGDNPIKSGTHEYTISTLLMGEQSEYKLNITRPASNNDKLKDLTVDGITIDDFDPNKKVYEIEIDDHFVREVEVGYTKGHYYQTTTAPDNFKVSIEPGTTVTDITITSEDGTKSSTYTIIFTQPLTTKLMSLSTDSGLDPEFDPNVMSYSAMVLSGAISIDVNAVPFDSEATAVVTGAAYIPAGGSVVTIRVTRDGVEDSIYTISVTKASEDIQTVYNYPYKGSVQMFVAPASAEYKLEAWGAAGGIGYQNLTKRNGGKGAYTSGKIFLTQGQIIYIYTGAAGGNGKSCGVYCGGPGGWNGGGKGGDDLNHDSQPDPAGGGGGATDFRLDSSLNSRIMVAGAGAGGSYSYLGRPANALAGDGSSQISGHLFGVGQAGIKKNSGSGGGGGGYWGGISNQVDAGQGYGGSSFVSGYSGAVAVKSATETTPRLSSDGMTACTPASAINDDECSEHYSGLVFDEGVVQAGNTTFPSPTGANETGHAGHGYARITMIVPPSDDNTLLDLSFTNSILSPTFNPADPEGINYTLSVPSTQPIITTTAVANHNKAMVTGDGVETTLLADTPTEIVVSVVSESGLVRDYVTTATRPANGNSQLDMITMGSIPSGLCKNNGEHAAYSCRFNDSSNNAVFFNPAVTDYYINTPTVSRKLSFSIEKGHIFQGLDISASEGECTVDNPTPGESGTVSCDKLPMGASEINIIATAENGTKTTYTMHVFRTPGADIQNIEVVHPPEEDTDILHYNALATDYGVSGKPDTEEVSFEITVDEEVDVRVKFGQNGSFEACAIGDNDKPVCEVSGLSLKQNDIWIQATLNGMVKTYYINWYRQLNTNTFLEYLNVTGALDISEEFELSPSFNKVHNSYTVYVPFTTTDVLISAEAERPDVSTVHGDVGIKSVAVGNNRFSIRVQAQDGSEDEYVVNVIRRADPDATITNIQSSTPFAPAFDPETFNYVMELDPHYSSIDFTNIVMQSDAATYQIIGNSKIMPGVTEVIVRGVAGDGTTKDYSFMVHMDPSSDNALASLQVGCSTYVGETLDSSVNCQLEPEFDVDETIYTMSVPAEVTHITLTGTPADVLSTVSGLGKHSLKTGTNEFNVTVTAQDGSSRVVTVIVERETDGNNLLNTWTLKKSNGQNVGFGFAPTENNYTVTVDNDVSQLTVAATALRKSAQVVLGEKSPWKLNVGENNFSTTVVAENGETNIYNIQITRKPSNDACLSKLSLQEAKIGPTFACAATEYTAQVPYRISEVTPVYTTAEKNATVSVEGADNLEVGDNTVTVKVTAQDGASEKEYNIVVHRREDTSSSSRLINLWTDVGTWNKDFDPDELYYEVDVTSSTSQVKVGGIVEDIDGPATVDGFGTHSLDKGENLIQVEVTAMDGTTTTYSLNVKRALSSDANLKSLIPNRTTLSPNFKSSTVLYTASIEEESIEFTALPRDDGATVDGADENGIVRYPLDVGENTIDIEVTAEDGITSKVYTVIVTRTVGTNAYLAEMKVGDNMTLSPSFKDSTGAYTVANVSAETESLAVYARSSDPTASVQISDETPQLNESTADIGLEYGTNHITVNVTAANGKNTMQYVVTVIRNLPGDNNLLNLVPSIGVLNPAFISDTANYTMDVDYMTKQISFESTVEHEMAWISYANGVHYSAAQDKKNVTSVVKLTTESTQFVVQVMSASGAPKNYTVTINRNQNYPSSLDDLILSPYRLEETFNSATLNYTVEVDYEIDTVAKLPINAIKSDPNATTMISGAGGGALSVGPNQVSIVVTSRDGSSTTTYNLNVIRRSYSNNFLTYISTDQSAQIEPEFDKYNLSYSMTVGNAVSTLNLSAEPENYNSSVKVGNVSFTGQNAAYSWPLALQYGTNTFDIIVTTSTNVKRVYKLTVYRELSSNTDLSNVNFRAGSQTLDLCEANAIFDPETMNCAYSPAFSNGADSYVVQVPAGTARGQINITPVSNLTTITGAGEVDLEAGHNEFVVKIKAQDGTERQITVDFVREALDVNNLIDLKVVPGAESGTQLEPGFNYGYDATAEAPYIVRVPGRISMLGFDVQLEDPLYSTVTGLESLPVPDGESTRKIIVTAENGEQREYNILLIKTPLDTNNYLDFLAVDGMEVPGFAPTEKFYYDLGTVPHEKDSVDITAFVTEPAQILAGGTGQIPLHTGDNHLQIRVQAENDQIRIYTIHINRTMNDDNTLINIAIPNHTLTNPFKPYNVTYYVVTSSKTTQKSLGLKPILSSPNDASYVIQYMQPEFSVGSNLVKIVVTAENGDQLTYYVYVVLQNTDENYHLEYLNTDIYELMEPTDPAAEKFSPTKFNYSFSVPMSQDRMCVTAQAESIQATILGAQDLANPTAAEVCYDLNVGINHIPITVVASNGVVQEYMLNVMREGTAGISRIVAVPEKRIPNRGNSNTWFLVEVVPAGQPYYKEDGSGTNVVWDNKADILAGKTYQTDDHGVWDSAVEGEIIPVAVESGEYDVYFTGYSHLSKKKDSVMFLDGEPIEIEFTYDEDTLADMVAAGTLDPEDPMYPLLAGDAGVASDSDLSCGPVIADCITGGEFSGDEWGDDLVNSLDTSAILTKLYATESGTQKGLTSISKEDLDGNGQINSLDMSITLNNLYKRGDK